MKRFALILTALGFLSTPAIAADNHHRNSSRGAVRHVQDHDRLNHRAQHRAETHHDVHHESMTNRQHAGLHNQLNHQAANDGVRHHAAHDRGRYYNGHRWVYGRHPRVLGYYPVVRYFPTSGFSFGTSGGGLSFSFER